MTEVFPCLRWDLHRGVTATIATRFMPQRFTPPALRVALHHLIAWVLDQPVVPPLTGQRCDRLRPEPVLRDLERALRRCGDGLVALVDWRWNSQLGCAEGYLWQHDQLQRFLWWRASDRLELHGRLRCTVATHRRPVMARESAG